MRQSHRQSRGGGQAIGQPAERPVRWPQPLVAATAARPAAPTGRSVRLLPRRRRGPAGSSGQRPGRPRSAAERQPTSERLWRGCGATQAAPRCGWQRGRQARPCRACAGRRRVSWTSSAAARDAAALPDGPRAVSVCQGQGRGQARLAGISLRQGAPKARPGGGGPERPIDAQPFASKRLRVAGCTATRCRVTADAGQADAIGAQPPMRASWVTSLRWHAQRVGTLASRTAAVRCLAKCLGLASIATFQPRTGSPSHSPLRPFPGAWARGTDNKEDLRWTRAVIGRCGGQWPGQYL